MASEGTKKDDPDLESTMEPLVLCKENGNLNSFVIKFHICQRYVYHIKNYMFRDLVKCNKTTLRIELKI